jgi:hypothetical protein
MRNPLQKAQCQRAIDAIKSFEQMRARGMDAPVPRTLQSEAAACQVAEAAEKQAAEETSFHTSQFSALTSSEVPIFWTKLATAQACVGNIADILCFSVNYDDGSNAAREATPPNCPQRPAVAAIPLDPVMKALSTTLGITSHGEFKGPYGEVGVVREFLAIPVDMDFSGARAALAGKKLEVKEEDGGLNARRLIVNSPAGKLSYNFTRNGRQIFSIWLERDDVNWSERGQILSTIEDRFGKAWHRETDAKTFAERLWWTCEREPAPYPQGFMALTDKCYYSAQIFPDGRLEIRYSNFAVVKAHEKAGRP